MLLVTRACHGPSNFPAWGCGFGLSGKHGTQAKGKSCKNVASLTSRAPDNVPRAAGLVLWLKILFRSKLYEVHVWPYFKSKVRGLGLLACLPCLLNPAVFIQSAAAAPVRRLPAAFPCFSLCKDSQCKGDCVRFHSPVARLVGASGRGCPEGVQNPSRQPHSTC